VGPACIAIVTASPATSRPFSRRRRREESRGPGGRSARRRGRGRISSRPRGGAAACRRARRNHGRETIETRDHFGQRGARGIVPHAADVELEAVLLDRSHGTRDLGFPIRAGERSTASRSAAIKARSRAFASSARRSIAPRSASRVSWSAASLACYRKQTDVLDSKP
jgi:hypothetical protein